MEEADVKVLARQLANIYMAGYETYKPMVDDACSRPISEKDFEWLCDHLLDFCGFQKIDELFDELCETYEGIYPECVKDYRQIYKDNYDDVD